MYDEKLLKELWDEREEVDGRDPKFFRLDPCGALIEWSKYGDPYDENGWVIDHVVPISKLKGASEEEIDDTINLRPMHYMNNITKEDDYPTYYASVIYKDDKNVEIDGWYEVNEELRDLLNEKYSKYLKNDIES